MPTLEDVSYSEAACVATVSDYYEFLVKMYLDESEVIYPPENGWPSIAGADPDALAKFGNTNKLYAPSPIGAFSSPTSPDSNIEELEVVTEGHPFNEVAPPHVVSLTAGGRDTPVILVDKELGVITWDDYPYPRFGRPHAREPIYDDPVDYAPYEEAVWRADGITWAIKDFFEVLKSLFLELFYIPKNRRFVIGDFEDFGHPQGMVQMLRGIYHEHGWPDLSVYRKEDCLNAVEAAMEANYPDRCEY